MKKSFLFAVAAMAVSAFASNAFAADNTITFSEIAAKGSLNGKTYNAGGFVLTVTDTDESKLEIDANNAFFGTADNYQKFEYRLKTGGKSNAKNALALTIPEAGKLQIFARTGSSSATDRNIILSQNSTELYNQILLEDNAVTVTISDKDTKIHPVIEVSVAAGTVNIEYPVNSIYLYGANLVTGGSGIVDVMAQSGVYYNGSEIITNGKNVTVYNVLGKVVAASAENINMTDFINGVYVVRVEGVKGAMKIQK
ncbi:MAG: hypothetical protein IJ680_05700 [Paludibacteraceae bacterium]|nr:hypothetical protein [Paludibacteraceae bacterium]